MFSVDARAVQIASCQYGLVGRWQLRAAGIDRQAVRRRVRAGVWSTPLPGVIDVGSHAPGPLKQTLALVLAAGQGAVASHHSAGAIWRLLDLPWPARIDVSVPRGGPRAIAGHPLRSSRHLFGDECDRVDGIPVTSRARTLLDLVGALPASVFEPVLWNEVRRDGALTLDLAKLLARNPRRPGAPRLRALLDDLHPEIQDAGSPLEVYGVLALRRLGLPQPTLQYTIRDRQGRFIARVDAAWPDSRVIVEFDGVAHHDPPGARHRDARVRGRLRALGWTVVVLRADDLHRPGRLRRLLMPHLCDAATG